MSRFAGERLNQTDIRHRIYAMKEESGTNAIMCLGMAGFRG